MSRMTARRIMFWICILAVVVNAGLIYRHPNLMGLWFSELSLTLNALTFWLLSRQEG